MAASPWVWLPGFSRRTPTTKTGTTPGGNSLEYLLPTGVETPNWETGETVTPSPHHPIGAKGVGESATVGAPPAFVNAVVDALSHLGVRHMEIPMTPARVRE